ncbi:hypothetical protein [Alloprevotella tannerae]|uniref:hypothetical protein n=1 Tax=Alloprevotella tannerae TaxID=76122 RepID=UPI0028E8CA5C|nr:hypothetical protein [Alloprevotella tannerae]
MSFRHPSDLFIFAAGAPFARGAPLYTLAVSYTKYGPTTIVRPTSTATAQGLRLGCFRRLTHVFLAPYAAPFSLIFTLLCPRFEDKASLALRTLTRGNLFYHERKLFLSRGEALFITSAKGCTGLTGVENQGCAHEKAHNDLGFSYLLKFILGGAQEQQV